MALSGDGGLLASGSQDGTLKLREAPSGRPLATLQGHTGGVYGVALSTDGRLLASGGVDGTVRLWEASSGTCLRTLRVLRTSVAVLDLDSGAVEVVEQGGAAAAAPNPEARAA